MVVWWLTTNSPGVVWCKQLGVELSLLRTWLRVSGFFPLSSQDDWKWNPWVHRNRTLWRHDIQVMKNMKVANATINRKHIFSYSSGQMSICSDINCLEDFSKRFTWTKVWGISSMPIIHWIQVWSKTCIDCYVLCTTPKSTAKLTTVSIICELFPKLLETSSCSFQLKSNSSSNASAHDLSKIRNRLFKKSTWTAEQKWSRIIPKMVNDPLRVDLWFNPILNALSVLSHLLLYYDVLWQEFLIRKGMSHKGIFVFSPL